MIRGYTYKELTDIYNEYFSLRYLGDKFENKAMIISLTCYVTQKAKMKKPGINCYVVLRQVAKELSLPDKFIEGLSIICENLMYGTKEFPTFGLKKEEIIPTMKQILNNYLPF